MATTPEGRIKRKLDKLLKEFPLWYFAPQAGIYGGAGIPDRIVCYNGRMIGVECKADATKELTKLQSACAAKIEKAGGLYFLVFDTYSLERLRNYLVGNSKSKIPGS